jgi:plastocyanin
VDTFGSGVPPAPVPTHVVQVGPRGALVFEPPEVSASMGDVIRFNFVSGNHTATQSSLEQPCVANGGFDTGFIGVGDGMPRHVDYIVDTDQAWFHW